MRRRLPCLECRQAHAACFTPPGLTLGDTCSRCARLSRVCRSPQGQTHRANELSDLRHQLRRLVDLNRGLSEAVEHSEATERASSSAEENLPVNDLCDRLTQLCFTSEGLTGPTFDQRPEAELVQWARSALIDPRPLGDECLDRGGFIYTNGSHRSRSLADIVGDLPAWETMERCLSHFPPHPSYAMEVVLTPRTPRFIEDFYRRGLQPIPDGAVVAEMFGMLAMYEANTATATSSQPLVAARHTRLATEYLQRGQEAFALAGGPEYPTLEGVRACYWFAYLLIICWKDASLIKTGLILLTELMSMIYRLGWNEDGEIPGETVVYHYERRMLACTALRLCFYFGSTWQIARKALFRHSSFTCTVPPYLGADDLPIDEKYEDYRPSPRVLDALADLTALAKLRGELHQDILTEDCTSERIETFLEEVGDLKAHVLTDDWQIVTDPISDRRSFTVPFHELPITERPVRPSLLIRFSCTAIDLHSHLIFGSNQGIVTRHRDGMIQALRDMLCAFQNSPLLRHSLPSIRFIIYPLFVAGALLIGAFSDMPLPPDQAETCEELIRLVLQACLTWKGETSPAASRLVQLLQFLLATEDTMDPNLNAKKQKTAFERPIRKCKRLPLQPPTTEPTSDSFTFAQTLCWPDTFADLDSDLISRKMPSGDLPSIGDG